MAFSISSRTADAISERKCRLHLLLLLLIHFSSRLFAVVVLHVGHVSFRTGAKLLFSCCRSKKRSERKLGSFDSKMHQFRCVIRFVNELISPRVRDK